MSLDSAIMTRVDAIGTQTFASQISDLLNPLFVALPVFLIVALTTAPDTGHGLLWWLITTIGLTTIPLTYILRGVQQGRFTDPHLSQREQRFVPLIVGLASTLLTYVILIAIGASRTLLVTIASTFTGGVIAILITTRWKVSLHMIGITGAVTILNLLYGPWFLLLTPLVVLIGWARLRVRAHTPAQAVVGTLVAFIVTVVMVRGLA
jgi:membrane-associated phospholipid phosphatase